MPPTTETETETPLSPPPPELVASAPLRFERGELPVHVLLVLKAHGPQLRSALRASAFGIDPTHPQVQRANAAVGQLRDHGLIRQTGEARAYLYTITFAGRAYLRACEKKKTSGGAPPPMAATAVKIAKVAMRVRASRARKEEEKKAARKKAARPAPSQKA